MMQNPQPDMQQPMMQNPQPDNTQVVPDGGVQQAEWTRLLEEEIQKNLEKDFIADEPSQGQRSVSSQAGCQCLGRHGAEVPSKG